MPDSKQIKIINGNLDQLKEIVIVNHEIFDGMYEQPPYDFEHYKEKLKNQNPVIFIAKHQDNIVGDSIVFVKNKSLYIWILGVLKKYRNGGIASRLMILNEQYAKDYGYHSITIKVYNVSKEMLRLLLARNYQITKVEQSKSDAKYNAIHLELKI